MKLIADLHTHTCASTHALNTVTEMATKAKELGYLAYACTDHSPSMPDGAHEWHFNTIGRLPKKIEGIWFLSGIEVNIAADGSLDLLNSKLKKLDWVVASMHHEVLPDMPPENVTDLWIKIAENSLVDMVGHPEQQRFACDFDRVTKAFAQNHKVVEINANSKVARPGHEANLRELALACKRNNASISLNSDAHSIYSMGVNEPELQMLKEIAFPEELIVNASLKRLSEVLIMHGKAIGSMIQEELS